MSLRMVLDLVALAIFGAAFVLTARARRRGKSTPGVAVVLILVGLAIVVAAPFTEAAK